ncbi:MAG: hypothetical protein ACLP4V_14490 [Methylocella sp.]
MLIEADRGRSFFQRGIKPATSAMRAAIVTTVAMSRDPFVYLSALTASKGTPAVLTYDRLFWDWSSLVECDVVFFHNYAPLSAGFPLDEVCYALHRSGVVTVAIASDEHISNWPKLCHLSLDPSAHGRLFDNVDREQLRALNHIDFRQIIGEFEKRRTPSIVIVCSAVNLPQLIDFSNIIGTTKIASKVEFVCVGHEDERAFSHYVMKRFARSWSEALSMADQDIAFLVGPEIQATHQFIAAHIFEHWYRDVDVVWSPIRENEDDNATPNTSASPDKGNYSCDLRALSLKRGSIRLDAIASLMEAGDDLCKASLIFNHRLKAICSVTRKSESPVISARNAAPNDAGSPWSAIGHRFSGIAKTFAGSIRRPRSTSNQRLRILSYRWHPAHQYEISRLPLDFTYAQGLGHITEFWPYAERPLRPNVKFRHRSEIKARDFDLCLVHFDENVLCPDLSNNALPENWGEPFAWLLSFHNLPKIAICHGTPPFVGQYALDNARKTHFEIHDVQRLRLVSALSAAGAFVVCNSWQAKAEWGFENCRVIWHGFDPCEFRKGTFSRDVLTLRHDDSRPHYRGRFEQVEVDFALPRSSALFASFA